MGNRIEFAEFITKLNNPSEWAKKWADRFVQDYFYPDIQAKGECEETEDMKNFVTNWLTIIESEIKQ